MSIWNELVDRFGITKPAIEFKQDSVFKLVFIISVAGVSQAIALI